MGGGPEPKGDPMKKLMTVLAAAWLLTACGGDDTDAAANDATEAQESGDSPAGQIEPCQDAVTSGGTLTAEQVEACAASHITASVDDCRDGLTLHVIAFDGTDWALIEGEPAQEVDGMIAARQALCDTA